MSLTHPSILVQATDRQLEQAAAYNHTELFCWNAIARGGEVRTLDQVIYTYEGPDHQSMIAFPSLDTATADDQLDEMMRWYAVRPNKGLGCWSLDPPAPFDLGVRLKARGFQDGWRPCWMARELGRIDPETAPGSMEPEMKWAASETGWIEPEMKWMTVETGMPEMGWEKVWIDGGYDRPAGVKITADNEISLANVKDLPYTGRDGALSPELLSSHPEQARQFVARRKGRIVGHCSAFLTTGDQGVVGIYDVAVVPAARGKGIGKALVSAACQMGSEAGYRYAVLNATGRRMYEQIGFRWVGNGFTWWRLHTG